MLDLLLPGTSGFEVYEKLRRSPETRGIPIIFLTGMLASPEDMRRSLDMGAADFVVKPDDASTTLNVVVKSVERVLQETREQSGGLSPAVLVIDDDRLTQALVQRMLSEAGFRVLSAPNAAEGLALAERESPAAVLLDYLLPDGNGLDLLRTLRQRVPDMAVIFMTAYGSEEVAAEALRAGADDYLIKPLHPWSIVPLVEENLEKRRQRSLLYRLVEELRTANQRLSAQQEELLAQNTSLQHAYAQLEEYDQLKEDWLGMMVHDLKSPLSIVLGVLDLLGNDFQPMMDAEQKEVLESGRRASEQLRSIMDNLLDVQRLETGKLAPVRRRTDLNEIVLRTVLTILPRARGQGIRIETELTQELPALEIDGNLVERVLQNLLDNAIKFSPNGGTLVVSTGQAGDAVQVSVADEGEGIPERDRTHIFEKFVQIHSGDMRYGGSGLGLTFCRLAVEAHGGRIWVEENHPRGSRFIFTLPLCHTQ